MPTDTEDHPERIDADENRGRLIVSEHVGRYLWAAQLADGLKVLDAGCGTGYGIAILEDAGAGHVVGVDVSAEAVASASQANPGPRVEVRLGDVQALPFSDGEFDLVVCFEVIEHVSEHEAVLDELARVVRPGGTLCISTPNRRIYPPGNPYHLHEYTPEEFAGALAERFSHVELYRQSAWLTSAILNDAEFAARESDASFSPRAVKLPWGGPIDGSDDSGEEMFTLALASTGVLPCPQSLLTIGDPFEVRWWQDQVSVAREEGRAAADREHADETAALRDEVLNVSREAARLNQASNDARLSSGRSAQRVLEVEEHLAQSNARIFALEEALEAQQALTGELQQRLERAHRVTAAMKTSISWRLTAPLRAAKRLF
jgi:2-polyprenyl-3-methyl-5-hydroxy-6-metoxy-1,4-benzoquinol methylase